MTYLLVALAAVAVLVALRLFLVPPRKRSRDDRQALVTDPRAALREVVTDPNTDAGRQAELQGDWPAARAAYARALEEVLRGDPEEPGYRVKRRALESKLEEIDRVDRGKG